MRRSKQGENTTSDRRIGDRIRYGGRWFSAASALQGDRSAASRARRALTCVAAALRRPQRVPALAVVLLRTPPLDVFLSGSSAGRALRAYFDQRLLGVFPKNRLCQGVLVLPEQRPDYLRGRRRHALRSNLRRAATAGITCEVMEDPSHAIEAVEMVTQSRRKGPLAATDVSYFRSLLGKPGMTLLVARDREGCPRAVLAAVIDEKVCLWEWATSNNHEARWALHDHLVGVLIDRGVKYLISSGEGPFGALGFTPNVQHYQHLIGYELRHVRLERPVGQARPERPVGVTRKRRLLASLVVALATMAAIVPRAMAHPVTHTPAGHGTPHRAVHSAQALPAPTARIGVGAF